MTSSPFPLLVLFIVTLIYSPLLYYLSNEPLALRQQDAFTHHAAKSSEKKPSTHHQKNLKAGAGGRARRQSAWAGASLSCDVAFWKKTEDFCSFWRKERELGKEDVPYFLQSSGWRGQDPWCQVLTLGQGPLFCWTLLRQTPPAFPQEPQPCTASHGAVVSCQDMGISTTPGALKTSSQQAVLAALCHGETEEQPPHGITLPGFKIQSLGRLAPRCPAPSLALWQPIPRAEQGCSGGSGG